VNEPRAERPYMPGYGILGPPRGKVCCRSRGLKSASPHPRLLGDDVGAGRPPWRHAGMGGIWHEGGLWFSGSRGSRKTRNLPADPRCAIATDNALEPVVIDGSAERIVASMRGRCSRFSIVSTLARSRSTSSIRPRIPAIGGDRPGSSV
jgi:hypothetical protein